jgi:hypothetical protein
MLILLLLQPTKNQLMLSCRYPQGTMDVGEKSTQNALY